MPRPRIPHDRCVEAIAMVEDALRQGHMPRNMYGGRSAVRVAGEVAVESGRWKTISTFESTIDTAKELYALTPDWSLYRPQRYQQPTPKHVLFSAPPPEDYTPTTPGERVLAIGDLHQDPAHPDRTDVLTWIARFASQQKFTRIIQIGDWSTNDSVSTHAKNDTRQARLKPSIKQDLDNLEASHRAFRLGLAEGYKPKLVECYGNHEYRLERFEDAHPESYGVHTGRRDEIFAQFGWRTIPYGEIYYVERVGFTHHPINGTGRAFGGETGPQRASNKTTISMVSGHTHKAQRHDAAKIGPQESVQMIEIGCAMPWGTIEKYVDHVPTGWWWGVVPMTVVDGMVTDLEFKSMISLKRDFA